MTLYQISFHEPAALTQPVERERKRERDLILIIESFLLHQLSNNIKVHINIIIGSVHVHVHVHVWSSKYLFILVIVFIEVLFSKTNNALVPKTS